VTRARGLRLAGWLCCATLGCTSAPIDDLVEPDLGPIEATLDAPVRKVWPGIDSADGKRIVPRRGGFFGGARTSWWSFGFTSPATADVFYFCREGTPDCPLDAKGRVNWPKLAGNPVYARLPGEEGYSPFWLMWVVTVPLDYAPNALKSVYGITKAAEAKRVNVKQLVWDHGGSTGKDFAIVDCHLVLAGTELEGNGAAIAGQPSKTAHLMPLRKGWLKGHSVELYDFSELEGVFAPDTTTSSKPLMRSTELWVVRRDCAGGSTSPLCQTASALLGAVDEAGAGLDLTGDGALSDTNHVLMGFPGAQLLPSDKPYAPLWLGKSVVVPAEKDAQVGLIDTTGDAAKSDLRSVGDVRAAQKAGLAGDPVQLVKEMVGLPALGDDRVFYNNVAIVPTDAVLP